MIRLIENKERTDYTRPGSGSGSENDQFTGGLAQTDVPELTSNAADLSSGTAVDALQAPVPGVNEQQRIEMLQGRFKNHPLEGKSFQGWGGGLE